MSENPQKPTSLHVAPERLKERWRELLAQHSGDRPLHNSSAASALGVSEAELIATNCGTSSTRLEGDWSQLVGNIHVLGKVMAVTRNRHMVLERKGKFGDSELRASERMGLAVGPDIDPRFYWSHWRHAFAVDVQRAGRRSRSLQFFSQHGQAVHKIFLTDDSDIQAWEPLIAKYKSLNQAPAQSIEPAAAPLTVKSPKTLNPTDIIHDWGAMTDTHQFRDLLVNRHLSRLQAVQFVQDTFSWKAPKFATKTMFEKAAQAGMPLMIFLRNTGTLQIHIGPVQRIVDRGTWLNVLDPDLNIHLRQANIAEAWMVRKPTEIGHVTSLELFGPAGNSIALIYGARKPGEPERADWRSLVESLVFHR